MRIGQRVTSLSHHSPGKGTIVAFSNELPHYALVAIDGFKHGHDGLGASDPPVKRGGNNMWYISFDDLQLNESETIKSILERYEGI